MKFNKFSTIKHRKDNSVNDTSIVTSTWFYQNVRGLKTKLKDFFMSVSSGVYSVIIITETWLDDDINDNELFSNQYIVYRKDRSLNTSEKKWGGGVLIAVNKSLKSKILPISDPSIEEVWISVQFEDLQVCVGTVYIPPSKLT